MLLLRHAFVEFASTDDAKDGLDETACLKIDWKPVKVEFYSQRPAPGAYRLTDFKLNHLHVACLPTVTTDDDMMGIFPKATKIDLPHAGRGKIRG